MQSECIFLHLLLSPFLPQNKPSRESIICNKVYGWWIEVALFMLNSMLKNLQNLLFGLRAYNQWLGKLTHILPPSKAVAGHTAHGQRRQLYANTKKYDFIDNILNISCVIKPKAPRHWLNRKAWKDGLCGWSPPATSHPYSAIRASVSPSTTSSVTGE